MNKPNFIKLKNIIKYFYLITLFFAFFACSQNQSPEKNSIQKEINLEDQKEEIKNTLIQMWNAIENEDLELYASHIHPDFTQFGETDSILSIGKETEINGISKWIEQSSNIHTDMIDPIITINGKVAWIIYYWSDSGITNGETFSSRGKSTRIFVKEKGKWLCIHGHYTLLP